MKIIDLSGSSRMSALMDLSTALRDCQNPVDALYMYCRYLRDAHFGRAHVVLSTHGLAAGQYRVWRLLTDDGAEHVELCNPWETLTLPIHSGGVLGKIIDSPAPRLVHEIDWSDDPSFAATLGGYGSLIAVPLFNEGLPLNWSLSLTREPNYFTSEHLEASVTRAALIGSLLGSLHVTRELANAHALIDSEIARMARIQRALLPDPIPTIPGLQLAASYETFAQVGGDLYDFVPLDSGANRWCIFIGDASGHGPSAAVVAAILQATLHDCAATSSGPADLFAALNRRLCAKSIEGSFVTAHMAFYDAATRIMRCCSAGHPKPLIPPYKHQPARFLNALGGPPLGIDETATFEETSLTLEPGQSILLYTDGISEARAPDGTMFEYEGIRHSLSGRYDDAQSMINRLRESLLAHQQGRRPDDDQTAVAIHVQSTPAAPRR